MDYSTMNPCNNLLIEINIADIHFGEMDHKTEYDI